MNCWLSFFVDEMRLAFVQYVHKYISGICISVFCHEILHFESYCNSVSQVTQSPKTSNFVNDVQSNSAEIYRAFCGHRFKPWNTWKIPNSQIQSLSCTAQVHVKAEKRRISLTRCLHESITQESASLRKPQRYLARNAQSLHTTIYCHLCDIKHLPTSLLCLSSPMW